MNKRLFVALDPPHEICEQLMQLHSALPGARWIPEEQLHLTLVFIGEVSSAAYLDICETLDTIHFSPFTLCLQGVGFFPPRQEPKVLWVGIKSSDALVRLQRKITDRLHDLGLSLERRKFTPHITLARLQDTPVSRLGHYLQTNNMISSEPFPINHFTLYSSILGRKGAQHFAEQKYESIGAEKPDASGEFPEN